MKLDVLIIRIAFVGLLVLLGFVLNPFEHTQRFGLAGIENVAVRHALSALFGLVVGVLIIAFEMRVSRSSLKTLIGAAVGSILGIVGAFVATYLGQALGWYRSGEGAGLIGAVVGAIIVLLIYGMVAGRRRTI